jgi:NAD(P)-dependent dehydrogenase (short-subunit alcohol dehydrogenase family)
VVELLDTAPVPDYLGLLDLTGREYLVVGAGQGMGRQVCHALAQAGARRILCADLVRERAEQVAGEIKVGIPVTADVATGAGIGGLVAATKAELTRLDGFVDIVGQASWATIPELTDTIWERDFAMCLGHARGLSQGLLDMLVADGGAALVFISSVSGMYGAPGHSAYGAAKAALLSWVESLAVELGPRGVRSNSVAPGTVLTPRMDDFWSPRKKAATAANAPLGRLGATADIAGAVLYLISDLASFVTGKTIVVDGGVGSKLPYIVQVDEDE